MIIFSISHCYQVVYWEKWSTSLLFSNSFLLKYGHVFAFFFIIGTGHFRVGEKLDIVMSI